MSVASVTNRHSAAPFDSSSGGGCAVPDSLGWAMSILSTPTCEPPRSDRRRSGSRRRPSLCTGCRRTGAERGSWVTSVGGGNVPARMRRHRPARGSVSHFRDSGYSAPCGGPNKLSAHVSICRPCVLTHPLGMRTVAAKGEVRLRGTAESTRGPLVETSDCPGRENGHGLFTCPQSQSLSA
jgi:hypothetical protein